MSSRGIFRHPPQPQQRLTTVQPPPPPPAQTLTVPLLESGGAYSTTVLTDTPSGYWRLGEPSGTTATDASGNGKTGTYGGGISPPTLGAAGLLTADADTAATFTGPTAYADVAVDSVSTLFDGTKSWSIEAWVKQTTDATFPYIFSATSATPYGIAYLTSSNLGLIIGRQNSTAADECVAAAISSGATHHVVATYDGSNLRLYVDGSLTGGPTASTRSTPTGTEASIGNYTAQSVPITATLDEVAVYNTALSAARISAHYTAGTTASAPAVYAPTIVAGPAQITVPLLDAGPALYAPTVAPQAVTLTIPNLDAANALYAPTLLGKNTLTVPALDAVPALYAPAVGFTLTIPALTSTSALYAPSVGFSLTVPLLDAGPALYAPTVIPGAVTLTIPALDAVNAVYAPTLTPQATTLTVPALDAANALYAPSVGFTITLGTIDGANALYAPVTYLDQFVTVPVLDAANALYAPSLLATNTLVVPLLDASNALYAPTIAPQPVTLTIPALDAVNALYAPTVAQVGGALQTITLGLLDASGALYAPSVGFTLTVPQLDAVNAVYAPSLRAVNTLTVPLLDASNAVYAPTLTVGAVTVTLPQLDAVNAVYAPTVTPAAWPLIVPYLDAVPAVYAPVLYLDQFLTPPLLDSGPALYAPSVGFTLTVPLLDSSPALYAPLVYQDQFLTPPLLDSGPALYAPAIGGQGTLVLLFIDSVPTLYAPTVAAAPVAITLPTLYPGGTGELTFADEFNGSSLDTAMWKNLYVGGAAGDPGFGLDSDFMVDQQQVVVANGYARITAQHDTGLPFGRTFRSAMIGTRGTFSQQYGTWEARIRYPNGQGSWPAWWALAGGSVSTPPEIDMMEAYPGDAAMIGGVNWYSIAVHYAGEVVSDYSLVNSGSDMTGQWHTHRMVWTPTEITFYLDDVLVWTTPTAAHLPAVAMYPIVGLAIGATGYRADGTTPTTMTMDVDYIRVYSSAVGAVLYGPSLTTANTITVPLLDAGPALYAPSVTTRTALTVPLLTSTSAVYAPTLAVGAVTLTVPYLDGVPTVYAPSLTAVGGGVSTITLPTLDAGNALYAPTVAPASGTITLGTIDAANAVYAPTVVNLAPYITLPTLDANAALYAPAVTPSWIVSVPLLDGVATVYAPELQKLNTLGLDTVDAGRALYPPSLEGGINLPFADIDIVDIDPGDLVLVAAGPAVTLVSVASAGVGTSIAGSGVVLSATSSPVAIVDIEVG